MSHALTGKLYSCTDRLTNPGNLMEAKSTVLNRLRTSVTLFPEIRFILPFISGISVAQFR
ncbi:hypothetical protein J2TS4_53550 [Paenibacillus sp. J2TS4]|nr:hypothetical protein J2TS4_53550 [Paenibacillus sp. J2TS4]